MKIIHFLYKHFLLLILCFVLVQCETEEEDPLSSVVPSIALEDSTYRIGSAEGILKFHVLSSRPDWEASTKSGTKGVWITSIKKNSSNDSLIVHYAEQKKSQSRSALIVLSSGSVRKEITCIQNGLSLQLSTRGLTVNPSKGQAKIGIKASDVNWVASTTKDPPWISSLEKNLSGDTLTINYEAQTEINILRSATINLNLSTLSKSISLTQQPFFIRVVPPALNLSPSAGTASAKVITSTAWTVSTDAGWITPIRDLENNTIRINYTAHTSAGPREAIVSITSQGKSQKLSITQSQARIHTVAKTYHLTHKKDTVSIDVSTTGSEWSFEDIEPGWVTNIEKEDSSLVVTHAANLSEERRSFTIRIKSGDVVKPLNFIQSADPSIGDLRLEIDPQTSSISLPREGGEQHIRIQILGEGSNNRSWNYSSISSRLYSIIRTSHGLSIHAAPNASRSTRSFHIQLSFTGGRILVNGDLVSSLDLTLTQDSYSKSRRPTDMPEDLYNHLNGDRILVLSPKIFIARRGSLSNQVTKEEVRKMISGYKINSINPLLLRLGTYIDPHSDIYYVDLSDGFNNRERYNVLDASGRQIKTSNNKEDSIVHLHDGFFRIFIINDLSKLPMSSASAVGLAALEGSKVWLKAGNASSHVLAHELGHSLGLVHTNTPTACEVDESSNFLMHASVVGGIQLAKVKTCENMITTGIKGRLNQSHGVVKKWDELGSSTAQDVIEGWRIMSEEERNYAINNPYLDGNIATRRLPQRTGTTFCGWYPGFQINETK